jgi:alkylhydroperoxidase family enzyme
MRATTALGTGRWGGAGLTSDQAAGALTGKGTDPKTTAALRLAEQIVQTRGDVSDQELVAARAAGLGDAEIAEVAAHVALNTYTNYLNRLARTEIDFPKVTTARARAGAP